MHGLEEALRIKDEQGARVTVVTMGPPPAEKGLKECISLGRRRCRIGDGSWLRWSGHAGDIVCCGRTIRKIAETWGPVDIVFCGKQTLDGDTGQVGPGVACRLDLEQLTYVNKVVKVDEERRKVTRASALGRWH